MLELSTEDMQYEEDSNNAKKIGKEVEYEDLTYRAIGATLAREKVSKMLDFGIKCKDILGDKKVRPELGVILYGPWGVGKSMLARECALNFKKKIDKEIENEYGSIPPIGCDVIVKYYKSSDYVARGTGKSADKLDKLFRSMVFLLKSHRYLIAIFEEIDSLVPIRKGRQTGITGTERTTAFLQEIDSVLNDKNILGRLFIIGTTNQPQYLDPAIFRSGRFRIAHINLPSKDERKELIEMYWGDLEIKIKEGDIKMIDLVGIKNLVNITNGFSPADIYYTKRDLLYTILEKEEGNELVTVADIISTISMHPITSQSVLRDIADFEIRIKDMMKGTRMSITDDDLRNMMEDN